jgi:hypothetical protein
MDSATLTNFHFYFFFLRRSFIFVHSNKKKVFIDFFGRGDDKSWPNSPHLISTSGELKI